MSVYAQGDVLIRKIADGETKLDRSKVLQSTEAGYQIILQHGEVTGHMHAIADRGVVLFRDDKLAKLFNVPNDLYVGHFEVPAGTTASLTHQEHDTIQFDTGVYEVRRQQEFPMRESKRLVAD